MKFPWYLQLTLLLALSLLLACTPSRNSRGDDDDDDAANDDDAADDDDAANDDDVVGDDDDAADDDDASDDDDAGQDCTDLPTEMCQECVAEENPQGAQAYTEFIFEHCICGPECGQPCSAECESGSVELTPGCDQCFQSVAADQGSACIQGFSAACQSDPNCLNFALAIQEC